MKISSIAVLAALAAPTAAEVYLKEQFNDKVRRKATLHGCNGSMGVVVREQANGRVSTYAAAFLTPLASSS